MSKQIPIQLSIPQPCSENWDEMTPAEQGRFCNHCQRRVIDFTTWSDKDLYRFFSKTEGPVCGRFFNEQLNRNISLPPQPPTRLYRIAVALGLTLMFTQVPNGKAHAQAPLVSQGVVDTLQLRKADSISANTIEVKGTIFEASKQPAIQAVITLTNKEGKIIGGGLTDWDGNFSIKPISKLEVGLVLKVQYAGHKTVEVSFKENSSIQIYLKEGGDWIMLGGPMVIKQQAFDPPGKTTIRAKDIKNMGY